jgi:hypothetical protein
MHLKGRLASGSRNGRTADCIESTILGYTDARRATMITATSCQNRRHETKLWAPVKYDFAKNQGLLYQAAAQIIKIEFAGSENIQDRLEWRSRPFTWARGDCGIPRVPDAVNGIAHRQ